MLKIQKQNKKSPINVIHYTTQNSNTEDQNPDTVYYCVYQSTSQKTIYHWRNENRCQSKNEQSETQSSVENNNMGQPIHYVFYNHLYYILTENRNQNYRIVFWKIQFLLIKYFHK